jgi:site-specific DNA recombinase
MNSRSDPQAGRRYACIKQVGTKKCGAMSVIANPVDQLVTDMLHDALLSVDLAPQETAEPDNAIEQTQDAIDAAIERLTSLAQDYGDGLITRGEYLVARQRSEARLRESQARQSTSYGRSALENIPPEQGLLKSEWEMWSLERRRAILATVVERVVIAPAAQPGRPTFDPDRVQVIWRL